MKESVTLLQKAMKKHGIDAYIVPTDDNHQSEYVGEYFKARAYLTGFTGSAGTAVVTGDEAALWTDGRYFIQAGKQLKDTGIKLQKMGEPGTPTIEQYLKEHLPEGGTLGFNGSVISLDSGKSYEKLVEKKDGKLFYEKDLVDEIWEDRPPLSKEPAFYLKEKYSGESSESKISRIREKMEEYGANAHLIGALDDICWMLNIRGNDVKYSPLVLCYAYLTMDEVHLYIDESKLNEEIMDSFGPLNLMIHPYDAVYEDMKSIEDNTKILIDPNKTNFALYKSLPEEVTKIEQPNPAILMKAMKNDTEIKNIKEAHVKDGVAWTRFMYWLKHNIGKTEITEISASDKLEAFREEQTDYLWPSFAPISGYGENAAIVHYSATEESNTTMEPKGLYLSDTGSNFLQGSTDITRTVVLGPITDEEREHFTITMKSHINLAMANFLHGTAGYALDVLARKPFWDRNLNFNHGTGHGIGYLLNIHEGPAGFRYKIIPGKGENAPLELGMVITNEPGIYIEGSHGVRLENEMIVREGEKNEYGTFYYFEPCTYVPFDLDGIDSSLLTEEEKKYLNNYHDMVYDIIAPHLPKEEADWLKEYTKNI